MYTPYDWQEAIGHRAQFVESKLALGLPVLAASFEEGILVLTYRRQARKLFEIYDKLVLGAVGQQSDIEAVRLAAIEFCHREGYAHSEDDVTLHRVLGAISGPIKRAFADFSSAPIVAQCLLAEVCSRPENDRYAVLEFDGDYQTSKAHAFVATDPNLSDALGRRMSELKTKSVKTANGFKMLDDIWQGALADTVSRMEGYQREDGLVPELALLKRNPRGESRYQHFREFPNLEG